MSDEQKPVTLGQLLYEELYLPDPARFPRGRKPFRALAEEDRARYHDAAEAIAVMILDHIGEEMNRLTPLISPPEPLDPRDVGAWLERLHDYIVREGALPE